jgi:asparagine N-glycosylation enzyme membrane subunit Stt3
MKTAQCQNNKTNVYSLLGSSGAGFGLNTRNFSFNLKYFYEYYHEFTLYVYTHNITVTGVRKFKIEDKVNLYAGLGYITRPYLQKYIFSGSINTNQYAITAPIGIEYYPFSINKFSVVFEVGLQMWHESEKVWKFNASTLELRYNLGKKRKL